jgi:hypothetical protein
MELPEERSDTEFEASDVPPKLLVALSVGLAASVAAVLVALALAFPQITSPRDRGPLQPLPPQPRLESAPAGDLRAYSDAEGRNLNAYGRTRDGHVHVPIEQAMKEVASDGWSDGK